MNKQGYTDYIIHLHANQYNKSLLVIKFFVAYWVAVTVLGIGFGVASFIGMAHSRSELNVYSGLGEKSESEKVSTTRLPHNILHPSNDYTYSPPNYSDVVVAKQSTEKL